MRYFTHKLFFISIIKSLNYIEFLFNISYDGTSIENFKEGHCGMKKRYIELDILRAMAIMGVLCDSHIS